MLRMVSLLLFGLMLSGVTHLIYAQERSPASIEGVVLSDDSGDPLLGVHVFLSGTTMGTVTDRRGYFRIQNITPGSYRLVVSIIGFGRLTEEISLSSGDVLTKDIKLKPVVYELDEIYAGNLDERWERHLDRFTRLFIGESSRAESVQIINPEVLRFETRWWGRFTAEALAPIQIESRELGYHITYYLKDFQHSGIRTRWDGDPLFRELEPVNDEEAKLWEENRREAFYGSLRHFMISVYNDEVEENGFVMFNVSRSSFGYPPQRKYRIGASRIIRDDEEEHLKRIRFNGHLEIIYRDAPEDPLYVRWAPDLYRGPANNQTSFLELNRRYITIDQDGEVKEVYGATRSGYFSFLRIADVTPREYRPEGF